MVLVTQIATSPNIEVGGDEAIIAVVNGIVVTGAATHAYDGQFELRLLRLRGINVDAAIFGHDVIVL